MTQPLRAGRRDFLRAVAAGTAACALDLAHLRPAFAIGETAHAAKSYRDFHDVYRQRWTWDRVGVGTHACTNCSSGGCAWDLYVKDGIVWREEQGAPYTPSFPGVPDYSPRGCQKGASASALYRSPARLLYPLKRAGARGENRWKRISWDEALDEVAGALVDTIATRGGAGALVEEGSNGDYGPSWIGMVRLFGQLGIPITDNLGSNGDMMNGATLTLGNPASGHSSDDWFRTDYFVNWFGNPVSTRIPDAHFITEARYRGAKIVSITPDFNSSAMHADLWIPVRPGTDAALALAACRVIIDENLHDRAYVIEQTDLPLLVRTDTRQLLRHGDVVDGARKEWFGWWDEKKRALVWSASSADAEGKRTLLLNADDHPALEAGDASVTLRSGETVAVRTAFSLLRERLAAYDPDSAARITGVSATLIRRFAREFAAAKSAMIYFGVGGNKILHGDLVERATILLAALTGNNGRAGGGWQEMTFFELDGKLLAALYENVSDLRADDAQGIFNAFAQIGKREAASPLSISGSFMNLFHGGTYDTQLNPDYNDRTLPRAPEQFLKEALARGDVQALSPELGHPDVIVNMFGNPLRHRRMGERLTHAQFGKAKLIVDVTLRMDDTARHSDILLPSAAPYEKMGFKYGTAYPPWIHLADKVVNPLGESKPDWEIMALLAARISDVAKRRNVRTVKGYRGQPYDLTLTAGRFSDKGRLGPLDEEKVMRLVLALSPATRGITLEKLRANKGAMPYTGVSRIGNQWLGSAGYKGDGPLVAYQDMVVHKRPWPTNTGRQQFYLDHPLFIEVGEELPVHKEPPMAGGDYPLTLTCSHTRWSVHTTWSDLDLLLRLQRGEPLVFVNPGDAARRSVRDHDYVAVHNDLGEFVLRAKLAPGMRPGQVLVYHGWPATQFVNGRANDAICPSPAKVTHFAGQYGHVQNVGSWYDLGANDRDTRVDFRKVAA